MAGCLITAVSAHDLFLKLDTYYLQPDSRVTIRLMNGSLQKSEGAVARDRMTDVSVVMPTGEISHPPVSAWHDEGKTALLDLQTGEGGTYVVSVSTKPREIDLKASEFNEYLTEDGIPDVLDARKKSGQLGKDVRERYSKHVRAIYQVGETLTESFRTPLGYPVEIIPQQNPYRLKVGQTIEVLCTLDSQPLVNQYVLAGWEPKKGRNVSQLHTRTDAKGIARFKLKGAGKWYVKLIHMAPLNEPPVSYESKWATLTFEIR